jgi:hypothetical protein
MARYNYLTDPTVAPVTLNEAHGTYRVDEGVLVGPGDGLKADSHMAHEQEAAEQGTFRLRIGPTPEGYALPDTTTITIRKAENDD